MKKDYKMLALDFDGTTLDSAKRFPAEISAAVHELKARGIEVIVSSGRGKAELKDYEQELVDFDYGVMISGGLVYDFCRHQAIFRQPIPQAAILAAFAAAEQEQAMTQLLTVDESVTRGSHIARMEDFHMEIYREMYERVCRQEEDLAGFIAAQAGEICKMNIYHRDENSRLRNYERLEKLGLSITFAEQTSLELSAKGISKAHGLKVICDHLGISTDEVVAIGDAPNDEEVLKLAGLGVAMGNASEEIKAISDVVVADNDHLGVLEAINKFF
ncbi:hypothetical protein SAMN02910356_00009 [Selenomonas sp. GACV-9]|uniref:Cof-type HAD-IIB family hydrolase n=1 Tax=Selenomonas sp. GACV-9 TaxID=3158782 RepID=UPI0008F35F32|nr:hypothetical protein SAMN02910356_00009 [Selenomonas ruminantium]